MANEPQKFVTVRCGKEDAIFSKRFPSRICLQSQLEEKQQFFIAIATFMEYNTY